MALEYIVQPQVFLGGLTALGPGIFGLTEQYPLLTTYQSWTSTASVPASTFPIPGSWSIYDGPNKEGSFIVTIGGVIQPPGEYTIDHILRKLTFNTVISADIEVAVTQLATASPSSQDFSYIKTLSANITNLSGINGSFDTLLVSKLTALSSILQITDILISETSGFAIVADSSTDALRIEQAGTGNALSILDNVNLDSTPFVINNKGQIVSGVLSAFNTSAALQIASVSSLGIGATIDLRRAADDNTGGIIRVGKARGTHEVPNILSADDVLGNITFYGHDGVGYANTAIIRASIDGEPNANLLPTRLTLFTRPSSVTTPQERMRITSAGLVGIGTLAPNRELTVSGNISATGVVFASGVGIGTSTPNQQLTVIGNVSATGNIISMSGISATGNITNGGNIVSLGNFVNAGNVTTTNVFGNLDGNIQIQNQSVDTNNLRSYFTLKAAVDRSLRTIFVVTSGSGYTTTPFVSVAPPTEPWGRQATAVAVMSGTALSAIIVTDIGTGYTRTPTVTISGGGGLSATAIALTDGDPLGEKSSTFGFVPGYNNTVVLANDGNLYSWGANTSNNIGLGTNSTSIVTQMLFNTSVTPAVSSNITYTPRAVKFWRSGRNTYVLDQTGALWSCGINDTGQLGLGLTETAVTKRFFNRISPEFFNNRPVIDFAVSEGSNTVGTTCLARNIDNDLFGWGYNATGALGINNLTNQIRPVRILTTANGNPTLSTAKVEQIYTFGGAVGTGTSTFIVLTDKRVFATGHNTATGHLGVANVTAPHTTVTTFSSVRTGSSPLTGIDFICSTGQSDGYRVTYFLDSNKVLYSCGYNGDYELGYGAHNATSTGANTVSATLLSAVPIEFVRCGSAYGTTTGNTRSFVYAYGTDGRLWSWGCNNVGQLGNGTATIIATPSVVSSGQNDSDSANSQTTTRYLLSSGANNITWGPGSIADITTLNGGTAILRTDGKVFVTGLNSCSNGTNTTEPKLGTGDNDNKTIFTKLPDFPYPVRYLEFSAASGYGTATQNHFIAILSDGSIYITGRNNERQINPTAAIISMSVFTPVQLGAPPQIT